MFLIKWSKVFKYMFANNWEVIFPRGTPGAKLEMTPNINAGALSSFIFLPICSINILWSMLAKYFLISHFKTHISFLLFSERSKSFLRHRRTELCVPLPLRQDQLSKINERLNIGSIIWKIAWCKIRSKISALWITRGFGSHTINFWYPPCRHPPLRKSLCNL